MLGGDGDMEEEKLFGVPRIIILGVGGAGNNSINRLEEMGGIEGVERVAINTDKLHLDSIKCEKKLLIGKSLTRGLGAGGSPDVGRKAAEMDKEKIEEILKDKNLVFLTAGMGGGTGTGALPVIAEIARNEGAIVIAMVSFPLEAERARRRKAMEGIKNLREVTNTVVVLENDKLVRYVPNLPINDAFRAMDELIADTIKGIAEAITKPSLVNLDYADLKAVMEEGGVAVMLVGETEKTEDKTRAVVESTLNHPLLEADYKGAKGALIHITGGPDLTIKETNDIVTMLTHEVNPEANVIWGTRIREDFSGRAKVTAIMTGVEPKWTFGGKYEKEEEKVKPRGIEDIIPMI
ncbi:MAG: cell division protein FtsZ [Candidatus Methanospirareceae archaeon]